MSGIRIGQKWERLIFVPQCLGTQLGRVGGMRVIQMFGHWNHLEASSRTNLAQMTPSLDTAGTINQSTYMWPLSNTGPLTAWQLGSKREHPKRKHLETKHSKTARWKCRSFYDLTSEAT